MPLIERLADYGIFEMDQHEREELLLNIQNKLTNCKPYNPKTKLKEIIERFKKRHERRLEKTFEQDPSLSFLTIVNSFVMINKLILWSVNRGIHDIHYLRHIKKNMIDLSVKKKKIIGNIPFERLKNSRLLEHFIMLIYFIEQSHKNSWEFRKANYNERTKRNYVKEAIDNGLITALDSLRDCLNQEKINSDSLNMISLEYEMTFSMVDGITADDIIRTVNDMIEEVNQHPTSTNSFSQIE